MPVGNHIPACKQCTNAWRVLTWDGRVASQFAWSDPADTRKPEALLIADGVRLTDGKADPAQLLRSDDLIALIGDSLGNSPSQSGSGE